MNQSIYPCLWYNQRAKEATKFYRTLFSDSEITAENILVSLMEIEDQKLLLLNAGPEFVPNPSASLFVNCKSEEEIEKLCLSFTKEGKVLMKLARYNWAEKYAWVKDKYEISWQLFYKPGKERKKIRPSFMFHGSNAGRASEAIGFYTSVFPNSGVKEIIRYSEDENQNVNFIKYSDIFINEFDIILFDSALKYKSQLNESFSLVIECETQDEIDKYWLELSKKGLEGRCGWVKDQFGISWQIVPKVLHELVSDEMKAPKVVNKLMGMGKLNIRELIEA